MAKGKMAAFKLLVYIDIAVVTVVHVAYVVLAIVVIPVLATVSGVAALIRSSQHHKDK